MNTSITLATILANAQATSFLNETPLGAVIKALLAAVGVIVLIVAAVKSFGKITQGKVPDAMKTIFGAVLLSVFLFQPSMMIQAVTTVSKVVSAAINSTDKQIETGCTGFDCATDSTP
jgi:uncharacterized membrane protein